MNTVFKMGVMGLIIAILLSVSSVVWAGDRGKNASWHGEDEPPSMFE